MTPGWNDPPILSHNVKSNTNKTNKLSNKRVAFPISSNSNMPQNIPQSSQIPAMMPQSQPIFCNIQNFNEAPNMNNEYRS